MAKKLKGRPLLTEGKRVKKVDARFTEKEYQLILDMEITLGISKTELVRLRVLENAKRVVINAKDLIVGLDTIGAELGRSGNNINQLARYSNILRKKGILSPVVTERFNLLFESYLIQQKLLETALRKILREMGNQ
jgi:putative heme degradation protein